VIQERHSVRIRQRPIVAGGAAEHAIIAATSVGIDAGRHR
jgi:hypothetical protein